MPDSAAWALGIGSRRGAIPWQCVAFVVLPLSAMGYPVYRELRGQSGQQGQAMMTRAFAPQLHPRPPVAQTPTEVRDLT
jgi:hypothetical protein